MGNGVRSGVVAGPLGPAQLGVGLSSQLFVEKLTPDFFNRCPIHVVLRTCGEHTFDIIGGSTIEPHYPNGIRSTIYGWVFSDLLKVLGAANLLIGLIRLSRLGPRIAFSIHLGAHEATRFSS